MRPFRSDLVCTGVAPVCTFTFTFAGEMEESNLIPTAPTTAAVAATTTQRSIAALPKVSLKLPILPPFDTPESIIQALASRETAVLIAGMSYILSGESTHTNDANPMHAGLLQIEKRGLAIVSLEQPRAIKDPLLDYLSKYPTVDGLFAAWDTAHKVKASIYFQHLLCRKRS